MQDVYSFHEGHLFLNTEMTKSAVCLRNLIYKICQQDIVSKKYISVNENLRVGVSCVL